MSEKFMYIVNKDTGSPYKGKFSIFEVGKELRLVMPHHFFGTSPIVEIDWGKKEFKTYNNTYTFNIVEDD